MRIRVEGEAIINSCDVMEESYSHSFLGRGNISALFVSVENSHIGSGLIRVYLTCTYDSAVHDWQIMDHLWCRWRVLAYVYNIASKREIR